LRFFDIPNKKIIDLPMKYPCAKNISTRLSTICGKILQEYVENRKKKKCEGTAVARMPFGDRLQKCSLNIVRFDNYDTESF
jgi:hypothetical protein